MRGDPALISGELQKPLRTEAEARAARGPAEYWINVWRMSYGDLCAETVHMKRDEMLADITYPYDRKYVHTISYSPSGCVAVNLQDQAEAYDIERQRERDAEERHAMDLRSMWVASR